MHDQFWEQTVFAARFDGPPTSLEQRDIKRGVRLVANGNAMIDARGSLYRVSGWCNGSASWFNTAGVANDVTVLGTGDFTVEARIYRVGDGTWQQIVGQWNNAFDGAWALAVGGSNDLVMLLKIGSTDYYVNSGAYKIPRYKWVHVAVSRKDGIVRMFIDGMLVGTADRTGINYGIPSELYIGRGINVNDYLNAFFCDVRITRAARYIGSFAPPSTPMQGNFPTSVDGDPYLKDVGVLFKFNGPGIFNEMGGGAVSSINGAAISSADSRFGGSSLYLSGLSAFIRYDAARAHVIDATNVCFEGWFKKTENNAGQRALFGFHTSAGANVFVVCDGAMFGDSLTTASFSDVCTLNQWTHVAAEYSNGVFSLYKNGQLHATTVGVLNVSPTDLFTIGQEYDSGPAATDFFKGYVDEFRISRRLRYGGPFTPPTAAFPTTLPAISGVVQDANGLGCSRTVAAFDRRTGVMIGAVGSAPDGTFSLAVTQPSDIIAVALDDDAGDNLNAVVFDRVSL